MSNLRLLDRQISLLTYLTSGPAIFGEDGGAPADPVLRGFDVGRLRLEAMFSFEKRFTKIEGVFPKTLGLLGQDRDAIYRGFVAACPPVSIGRFDNARQFFEYLSARWAHNPPEPPYLPDIATYEFAMARLHTHPAGTGPHWDGPRPAMRLHPRTELLQCEHDIRPLFEAGEERAEAVPGGVFLAIAMPDGAGGPAVFQIVPEVYRLLECLTGWLPLSEIAGAERSALMDVADALSETGLIEVTS